MGSAARGQVGAEKGNPLAGQRALEACGSVHWGFNISGLQVLSFSAQVN
jgi:hypothetical protein